MSAVLWAAGCAAPGMQHRGWVYQPEVSMSSVSEEAGEPSTLRTFGAGGRIHRNEGRWGYGAGAEMNLFGTKSLNNNLDRMAAALVGVHGTVLSADGYVASMIGGGAAFLVEGSDVDEPGALGFYIEARPVIYRLQLEKHILGIAPLSGAVLVPEPGGIPLVDVQFRVNVSLELR